MHGSKLVNCFQKLLNLRYPSRTRLLVLHFEGPECYWEHLQKMLGEMRNHSAYNWCMQYINSRWLYNQEANIVHQELAVKCGLSWCKPTPCYKCEPYCARELSKMYSDRSITTDQTVHNKRSDVVTLDKAIKEAYLIPISVVTASTSPLPRSSRNIQT